jgi:hypothetical protein
LDSDALARDASVWFIWLVSFNQVIWHERMGLSADEIASQHGLSLADVYAALAYYYDHRQAIDEAILADESYVAELRSRTKSKLTGKISG